MPEKMFVHINRDAWMPWSLINVLETLTAYYSSVKIFRQWRCDKYGVLAIQSSELRNAYTRKGRGICEGPIPKTGIKISQRSEEAIFLMKSFGAFLTECPAIYFAFVWQIQTKITNWFNSVGHYTSWYPFTVGPTSATLLCITWLLEEEWSKLEKEKNCDCRWKRRWRIHVADTTAVPMNVRHLCGIFGLHWNQRSFQQSQFV